MKFREANIDDITRMHVVRVAVKENVLSNPALVTINDYTEYITQRGKGWVCEIDGVIVGFAIADLVDENIWALFIHPDHEKKGIGKKLHHLMMTWYFKTGKNAVWLSTAPNSRAEMFYRKAGWKSTGTTKSGEIKFEMTASDWK
jgi:GNAT superfamily N-acetyltransferase